MEEYSYSLEEFIFIPAYHPFIFIHSLWLSSVFPRGKENTYMLMSGETMRRGEKEELAAFTKGFPFPLPKVKYCWLENDMPHIKSTSN